MAPGSRRCCRIEANSVKTAGQCPTFPQALAVALYVITFGHTLNCFMSSSNPTALAHWLAFSQALMTALQRIRSGNWPSKSISSSVARAALQFRWRPQADTAAVRVAAVTPRRRRVARSNRPGNTPMITATTRRPLASSAASLEHANGHCHRQTAVGGLSSGLGMPCRSTGR